MVDVYGQAPRIELFTKQDNLGSGPVPYGCPIASGNDQSRHAAGIPRSVRRYRQPDSLAQRQSEEIRFRRADAHRCRDGCGDRSAARRAEAALECGRPAAQLHAGGHDIDVLTTGVGMVATAAWSSRVLAMREYDVALNLGVCGSFDPTIPAGAVVQVVSEELPEMGAEADEAFLTLHDLKLLARTIFRFATDD
jgi:hypothetical protein